MEDTEASKPLKWSVHETWDRDSLALLKEPGKMVILTREDLPTLYEGIREAFGIVLSEA